MKISNRNTIKNQLHKILLLFCGLFLFTSIFLGDSSFSSGRYEIENYSIITNQKKTDKSFFQNWTLSLPYNVLSILNSESEEESEPTYESKIESDFQIIISFFNHNIFNFKCFSRHCSKS